MTSCGQCPRGGACECPRVGVFFNFPEGESPLQEILYPRLLSVYNFGQSTPPPPPPPLTKAFPYAYGGANISEARFGLVSP